MALLHGGRRPSSPASRQMQCRCPLNIPQALQNVAAFAAMLRALRQEIPMSRSNHTVQRVLLKRSCSTHKSRSRQPCTSAKAGVLARKYCGGFDVNCCSRSTAITVDSVGDVTRALVSHCVNPSLGDLCSSQWVKLWVLTNAASEGIGLLKVSFSSLTQDSYLFVPLLMGPGF